MKGTRKLSKTGVEFSSSHFSPLHRFTNNHANIQKLTHNATIQFATTKTTKISIKITTTTITSTTWDEIEKKD